MALTHDALNYFLRGIFGVVTVAMAMGDEKLTLDAFAFLKNFERSSGLGGAEAAETPSTIPTS
jgi:hypothetical protein